MFKKLKFYLRNYFAFNQTEIKGFMALIILMILLIISIFIFDYLPAPKSSLQKLNTAKIERLMTELAIKESTNKRKKFNDYEDKYNENHESKSNRTTRLFPFNPNETTQEQFEELGLAPWLAKRIINYRTKGGQFRKKQDLQRIYDFPVALYTQLEPFIRLSSTTLSETSKEPKKENSLVENLGNKSAFSKENFKPITFDLNKADTNDLKKIKGIGSKLSARIIKFRESIGGFYAENQIKEIFGLDSTVIQEVLKYAVLKNPQLRKININQVTLEELKHPYLKSYIAKSIIAYRQQHGNFSSRKDLENLKLLDPKTLDKLFPYLAF